MRWDVDERELGLARGSDGFGDEEVGDEGGGGACGAVAICGDGVPKIVPGEARAIKCNKIAETL